MIYDLQKASVLKRISAFLLDFILLTIIITGSAFLISEITGYDAYSDTISEKYTEYEEKHGVSFDIEKADYDALPEEQRQKIDEAYAEFAGDEAVIYAYNMTFNLTLVITSVSILIGYLIIEFIIPLILKNGQTVGKKVFAIGVMQTNGVRIKSAALFTRAVLGKYTIETMVPIIILTTILFGSGGIVGAVVIVLILIMQFVLMIKTKTNSCIHDIISFTVTVDMASQLIFDTEDDLIDYKKRVHAEMAQRSDY